MHAHSDGLHCTNGKKGEALLLVLGRAVAMLMRRPRRPTAVAGRSVGHKTQCLALPIQRWAAEIDDDDSVSLIHAHIALSQ